MEPGNDPHRFIHPVILDSREADSRKSARTPVPLENGPRKRLRPAFLWGFCYFLLSLALIFQGQFSSGITHAEFGHFPDEPAHAMTSLFFRDYMAAHFPSPMRFAEAYYLHYPKIAIGIWPPFFYTLAGAWLLLFGTSHASFLIFIATMGATLATTLSLFVRKVCGGWLGLCAGALFLCLRPVRFSTTTMMVDTTLTLMCFLATLCLIRYFKTGRLTAALSFGFFAAVAMLTKGNALELLLLVPLMCVVTGQYRVLLKKDLYLAGLIIALLGIPWQILSVRLLKNASLIETSQAAGIFGKAAGYLSILWEQLGPIAVLGLFFFLLSRFPRFAARFERRSGGRRGLNYEIAGAGCLAIAVYLFHVFAPVPGPDGRYMMGALPPLIFLFLTGISWLARSLQSSGRSWIVYGAAAILVAFAMPSGAWIIPKNDRLGMENAAQILHASGKVILVNAESSAEGAFIFGVALLDGRPEHIVVRASKVMSDNAWTSTTYKPVLKSPDEVRALLARIPIDSVLVDLTNTGWEQDRALLLDSLRGAPSEWRLSTDMPVSAANSHHLQIYSRIRTAPHNFTDAQIQSNVKASLARKFE